MPNGSYSTERSRERKEPTLKDIIDRDSNPPSIFCWTLINENWGVDLVYNAKLRAWLRRLYLWLKTYDPLASSSTTRRWRRVFTCRVISPIIISTRRFPTVATIGIALSTRRHQEVEEGENRFFDLAGVFGSADQSETMAEIECDDRWRAAAMPLRAAAERRQIEDREFRAAGTGVAGDVRISRLRMKSEC